MTNKHTRDFRFPPESSDLIRGYNENRIARSEHPINMGQRGKAIDIRRGKPPRRRKEEKLGKTEGNPKHSTAKILFLVRSPLRDWTLLA